MNYQRERDQFIVQATSAGLSLDQASRLLRCATTLHRLAEAQCNGDWPADNGTRTVEACPVCGSSWVPSQITGGARAQAATSRAVKPFGAITVDMVHTAKACPDCRTESLVHEALDGSSLMPECGGDPRGCVLKLYQRGTPREDIDSGRARAIYVPGRY
jgi:hypothetical protein